MHILLATLMRIVSHQGNFSFIERSGRFGSPLVDTGNVRDNNASFNIGDVVLTEASVNAHGALQYLAVMKRMELIKPLVKQVRCLAKLPLTFGEGSSMERLRCATEPLCIAAAQLFHSKRSCSKVCLIS